MLAAGCEFVAPVTAFAGSRRDVGCGNCEIKRHPRYTRRQNHSDIGETLSHCAIVTIVSRVYLNSQTALGPGQSRGMLLAGAPPLQHGRRRNWVVIVAPDQKSCGPYGAHANDPLDPCSKP